jgi:hypothetical protein
MLLTGRERWTLVAVYKATGDQQVQWGITSHMQAEWRMESLARLQPGTFSAFVLIATREGTSPQIAVFESPT